MIGSIRASVQEKNKQMKPIPPLLSTFIFGTVST